MEPRNQEIEQMTAHNQGQGKDKSQGGDNLLPSKRTGLVLEGGGMRGIYTAGVLDVFMEHDITFDGVIGVSAGAVHGSSYVAKQKGRNIRYYKTYCNDKRFISLRNLFLTGDMVGEQFCYHDLPETLEPFDFDTYNAAPTKFYVTCSNLETGKAEYLEMVDMKDQVDLLRASASLPLVSKTVEYGGKKLMDGGCTDSIPVVAFHNKLGYKKIVVVQTRQRGYIKKNECNPLIRLRYRKYPNFIRALERRGIRYNRSVQQIEKLEAEGKVFVIRPSEVLTIGRLKSSPEELQAVYDLGRRDAEKNLAAMLRWRDGV